ncbi:cytochrome c, class I [Brucella sp. BO2]|nr:cytochrome c, class I [Brucella inopinata BO1]EFM60262.1 cytochrome c, class I [Brucella sp. BO2]CAB4326321.1 Cytochrome c heme-binding site [Brucella sp. 191011898]SCD24494.1 cytochrome c2 [Brucella inopinata]
MGWAAPNETKEFSNMRAAMTAISAIAASLLISTVAQGADIESGKKIFNACKACHQIGEGAKNMVGPELNGLFGRHSGSVEGYKYSDANKNSGITWDEEIFRKYIKKPREVIPKTKMVYAGLKDEGKIDDLIAFIKQYDLDGKIKE